MKSDAVQVHAQDNELDNHARVGPHLQNLHDLFGQADLVKVEAQCQQGKPQDGKLGNIA